MPQYIKTTNQDDPVTIPSSLLDATVILRVVRGVWFYNDLNVEKIKKALQILVDNAPWLGGNIRFVQHTFDNPTVYQRFRHTEVTYYHDTDLGIELDIDELTFSRSFAELLQESRCASDEERPIDVNLFAPDRTPPQAPFVSIYPNLRVKITKLKDGVTAIGILIPHCLADTITANLVMACLADAYNGKDITPPTFDPRAVDKAATPLDTQPNEEALAVANSLPHAEYDYWSATKVLPFLKPLCIGPPELLAKEPLHITEPVTLETSDTTQKFKFSPNEIKNIYEHVNKTSAERVSHMLALIAHSWSCIVRVRKLDDPYALLSIGLRSRLPGDDYSNFAGNFVQTAKIETDINTTAGDNALRISRALQQFNKGTLPALLHKLATRVSPYRQAFHTFEKNGLFITTWIMPKGNTKKFQFGDSKLLYFERDCMPLQSYFVVAEVLGDSDKWYENGAYLYLSDTNEVLEALKNDPEFRKFK